MNFAVVEDKHGIDLWIGIIYNMNNSLDTLVWSDKSKARSLIDTAMSEAVSNPNKDRIRNFVVQLWELQPNRESGVDDGILKDNKMSSLKKIFINDKYKVKHFIESNSFCDIYTANDQESSQLVTLSIYNASKFQEMI